MPLADIKTFTILVEAQREAYDITIPA